MPFSFDSSSLSHSLSPTRIRSRSLSVNFRRIPKHMKLLHSLFHCSAVWYLTKKASTLRIQHINRQMTLRMTLCMRPKQQQNQANSRIIIYKSKKKFATFCRHSAHILPWSIFIICRWTGQTRKPFDQVLLPHQNRFIFMNLIFTYFVCVCVFKRYNFHDVGLVSIQDFHLHLNENETQIFIPLFWFLVNWPKIMGFIFFRHV